MRSSNRNRLNALFAATCLAVAPSLSNAATNAAPKHAFANVAENLVLIEFSSDGEERSALGVIATMDAKPYLLTNQHVLLGAGRMRFTTANGETLAPRSVELARDRDLARLALPERSSALDIATGKMSMNEAVALYRPHDDAEQRVKSGTIIGIGGMKFEVSTPFGEDDNGAPVLNEEGRVVGLASHNQESARHAMKKGTRFENEERHFCYRVDEKGWQSVNWRNYDRVFGAAYRENKKLGDELLHVFEKSQGQVNARRANELATRCRTQTREIEMITEHRGMTNYLLNELEQQAELFEYAERFFKEQASSR